MSNKYVQIKVLNDRNAGETPTQEVSLNFPFTYDKNSSTQYRAQLFYANSDVLSNISIGIAKGDHTTTGLINFDIRAYDAGATNLGLDSTPISSITTKDINTDLPVYDVYAETLYLTQHIPLTQLNFLNTLNQPLSVTTGNYYWLVVDLGRVYNKSIDGYTTPNLYFLTTTPGFSAIGNPNLTSYYTNNGAELGITYDGGIFYDITNPNVIFNPAPVKSANVDWDLADEVRDHIILVNGESLVRFGYSLDGTNYNYATWDDAVGDGALYDLTGWQPYGLYDISITNPLYGGTGNYGLKSIYIRFYKKIGTLYQTSTFILSVIEYNAYTPIVTEVIGVYTKLWN